VREQEGTTGRLGTVREQEGTTGRLGRWCMAWWCCALRDLVSESSDLEGVTIGQTGSGSGGCEWRPSSENGIESRSGADSGTEEDGLVVFLPM
jgi:hypothetical protein